MDEDLIEEEIWQGGEVTEKEKEKRRQFTWQGMFIVSILIWYVYYFHCPIFK